MRAEHTYESAGSYEVQLVASFEDGSTVVRSRTVVVAAGPSLAGSPPSPAPSRRPTASAQPTETPTATLAATPPQATLASESDDESADGEEPFPVYIVESGDWLAAIAKRFDVSISQLLTLNRIADPAVIEIGDRIRLPAGTSLEAPPIEGASGAPSGPPAGSAGAPPEAPNRSSPASTNGHRGAVAVYSMTADSQIPSIAEPWFLSFNADCRFRVAMTPEDLAGAGLDELGKAWG